MRDSFATRCHGKAVTPTHKWHCSFKAGRVIAAFFATPPNPGPRCFPVWPPRLPSWADKISTVATPPFALAGPLSAEDCTAQSMPDASPVKWHLAHTTWFFETFILERVHGANHRAFNPAFRVLFNSYYNAVGDKHPRPERGLLTRPGLGD